MCRKQLFSVDWKRTWKWTENVPESEPENGTEIGTEVKKVFLSKIIVQGTFKHLRAIYMTQIIFKMIFRAFRAHTPTKQTLRVDVLKLKNTFLGSQKLKKIDETNFFHKNYCIMYS